MFLGRIFLQNRCVRKLQKHTGFWRFSLFRGTVTRKRSMQSSMLSFHPASMRVWFILHEKYPYTSSGLRPAAWKCKKHMVCSFWVEWAKNRRILHIQLKNAKNHMFLHFYATGRSPSNHRWLNRVLKIVDSRRDYLILSTRLLCQIWGIEKSVFYHMRKISQKMAQRNWSILLSFGILIDFFQKLFFYSAPVKKFFILL